MRKFQIKFFNIILSISISRKSNFNINLYNSKIFQLKFLIAKYEFLNFININNVEKDNIDLIINMCNQLIPIHISKSKSVGERNVVENCLTELSEKDTNLIYDLQNYISKKNEEDNVIDRVYHFQQSLKNYTNVNSNLSNKYEDYEKSYCAKILSEKYDLVSREISLVDFFSKNTEIIKNKSILHFAPEEKLSHFMNKKSKLLNLNYKTTDLDMKNVDFSANIFDIKSFPSDSKYDLVIINRVFEHLIDDNLAVQNLYKLLNPNGMIIHSVPQNPSVKTTNWDVNDFSHNLHVRHYGKDYEEIFSNNGFDINVIDHLLKKTFAQHQLDKTYPMRLYLSNKIQ